MNYDIIVIGAGPGGIFSAYELTLLDPTLKIAIAPSMAKRSPPASTARAVRS